MGDQRDEGGELLPTFQRRQGRPGKRGIDMLVTDSQHPGNLQARETLRLQVEDALQASVIPLRTI